MIEYRHGDILQADAEALVNTVNCVGIMGRGVALQFKNAYPANFKAYAAACAREEVQPGRMFVFETGHLTNPKYIINFPTKRHWRGNSRIEDIEAGLKALAEEIRARRIRSIALPPLGSGLGGLDWRDVRPRIEASLGDLEDVRVIVFEPHAAPARPTRQSAVPNMTAGRAALVVLMHRYLGGLMDPFVTLLEVHKLMYFMQVTGQGLRLQFTQRALWAVCREPAARAARCRGSPHIRLCRWRGCARQAARACSGRGQRCRDVLAGRRRDPRAV